MALPVDNYSIQQVSGDTETLYDLHVDLSQRIVPAPPTGSGRRAASAQSLVIYADTVTLEGPLVNPGRDIRVYARKIIVNQGTIIDTSGASPLSVTDFADGQPAQQTHQHPGAEGASGAAGGQGLAAGNVTLVAESLATANGKSGSLQFAPWDFRKELLSALSRSMGFWSSAMEAGWKTFPDVELNGIFYRALQMRSQHRASPFVGWDPASGSATVGLRNDSYQFSGTYGPTSNKGIGSSLMNQRPFTILAWSQVRFDLHRRIAFANPATIRVAGFHCDFDEMTNEPRCRPDTIYIKNHVAQGIASQFQEALDTLLGYCDLRSFPPPVTDLTIVARGGRGGRGQDGHDGVKGSLGVHGVWDYPCQGSNRDGGFGGQGGAGGNPGVPGSGGPGGNITLGCAKPSGLLAYYDNSGGDGGPAALPGSGGPGGDPGNAGRCIIWEHVPNSAGGQTTYFDGHPGLVGVQGKTAAFIGAGVDGGPGQIAVNPGAGAGQLLSYRALAQLMPIQLLSIMQRGATNAFLNAKTQSDFKDVAERLSWLFEITQPLTDPAFASPHWTAPDIAAAAAIHEFARTMISQMERGLDFYGHPQDWVPLISLRVYRERIQALIDLGNIIEKQYEVFHTKSADQASRLQALDTTRSQLAGDLQAQALMIAGVGDQLTELDTKITSLAAEIEATQREIAADKIIFDEQFRRYVANRCSFLDVLKMVVTIVKVGAAGYENLSELGSAVSEVKKVEGAVDGLKWGIGSIKKAAATYDGVADGVREASSIRPDSKNISLVAVKRKEFDTWIAQYIGKFSAAAVLKRAVDHFFDLIDARNQAIYSYNAAYLKRKRLQALYDQETAHLASVGASRADVAASDPALPVFVSFMQGAYERLKTGLIQYIYEENRAYSYFALADNPVSLSGMNIATIASTQSAILLALHGAQVRAGGPFQTLNQQVVFHAEDDPIAFRAFAQSGKLTITMRTDNPSFGGMYQVLVSQLDIVFPDVHASSGRLFVKVSHAGNATQVSGLAVSGLDKSVWNFTHQPMTVPYIINYAPDQVNEGGVLGDQDYVGLSPFATWTFEIIEAGSISFDPKLVKSIQLTFKGTFR